MTQARHPAPIISACCGGRVRPGRCNTIWGKTMINEFENLSLMDFHPGFMNIGVYDMPECLEFDAWCAS